MEWPGVGYVGELHEVCEPRDDADGREGCLGQGPEGCELRPEGGTDVSVARQAGRTFERGKSLCKGLEAEASNYRTLHLQCEGLRKVGECWDVQLNW